MANSKTEVRKFRSDPLEYINSFELPIMKLVEGPVFSEEEINESLKKIVDSDNKPRFSTCFGCKPAVLLLLYAFLSQIGLPHLPDNYDVVRNFIDLLQDMFAGTGLFDNLFDEISKLLKLLSPWEIALRLCRLLRLCG